MDLLTVNQEKCLRCGICVECCPAFFLWVKTDRNAILTVVA